MTATEAVRESRGPPRKGLPPRHGKTWTQDDVKQLMRHARKGRGVADIATRMQRTETSIRLALFKHGVSLQLDEDIIIRGKNYTTLLNQLRIQLRNRVDWMSQLGF